MVRIAENNKRIAKNTFFLYFRSIFLLLINLYISSLTLQILGVEDFGIYQVVGGVVSVFSMLSSTLNTASQRFITYTLGENNREKLKSVFGTCITLHIVLGVIVLCILECLGVWFLNNKLIIPQERILVAGWVMQFSIATFFINVISVPYNAVIIAHEKMSAFAYISILEGLLKLGVVLLLMVIQWDKLLLYGIFHLVVAVILRIVYSVYASSHFEEAKHFKLNIDKTLFKDMFAFAGWNMIGSSALVLRNQGVDIVLNLFFGVMVNAAKGICNQVQVAVSQLVGNFTTAVRPQLVQSIARSDYERAYNLIFRGTKMSFMLMMIIVIPIMCSCEQVLSIWLVEVPKYTVLMVQISFFYLLATTLSRFLIDSILAYGKIKWFQITLGGVKLMTIPLTWLMIVITDSPYSGVIIITLIQFICLFGEILYSKKYINLNWKRFIKSVVFRCWGTFFCSFMTIYYLKIVLLPVYLAMPISIIISLFFSYLLGLDKKEKAIMRNTINKVVKKLLCYGN